LLPVRGIRTLGKRDMILNDRVPRIDIDPERYTVAVDGEAILPRPAATLPMAQRYFLF
jgi:urease subunit alpha